MALRRRALKHLALERELFLQSRARASINTSKEAISPLSLEVSV